MKNIILTHTQKFTLKEMLQSIKNSGFNERYYRQGYDAMIEEINKFLDMIE